MRFHSAPSTPALVLLLGSTFTPGAAPARAEESVATTPVAHVHEWTVPENAAIGRVVGRIEVPHAVRFDLESGDDEGCLAIDAATGEIRVRRSLDFESRPDLNMTVAVWTGWPADDEASWRFAARMLERHRSLEAVLERQLVAVHVAVTDVNEPPVLRSTHLDAAWDREARDVGRIEVRDPEGAGTHVRFVGDSPYTVGPEGRVRWRDGAVPNEFGTRMEEIEIVDRDGAVVRDWIAVTVRPSERAVAAATGLFQRSEEAWANLAAGIASTVTQFDPNAVPVDPNPTPPAGGTETASSDVVPGADQVQEPETANAAAFAIPGWTYGWPLLAGICGLVVGAGGMLSVARRALRSVVRDHTATRTRLKEEIESLNAELDASQARFEQLTRLVANSPTTDDRDHAPSEDDAVASEEEDTPTVAATESLDSDDESALEDETTTDELPEADAEPALAEEPTDDESDSEAEDVFPPVAESGLFDDAPAAPFDESAEPVTTELGFEIDDVSETLAVESTPESEPESEPEAEPADPFGIEHTAVLPGNVRAKGNEDETEEYSLDAREAASDLDEETPDLGGTISNDSVVWTDDDEAIFDPFASFEEPRVPVDSLSADSDDYGSYGADHSSATFGDRTPAHDEPLRCVPDMFSADRDTDDGFEGGHDEPATLEPAAAGGDDAVLRARSILASQFGIDLPAEDNGTRVSENTETETHTAPEHESVETPAAELDSESVAGDVDWGQFDAEDETDEDLEVVEETTTTTAVAEEEDSADPYSSVEAYMSRLLGKRPETTKPIPERDADRLSKATGSPGVSVKAKAVEPAPPREEEPDEEPIDPATLGPVHSVDEEREREVLKSMRGVANAAANNALNASRRKNSRRHRVQQLALFGILIVLLVLIKFVFLS